MTGIAAPWQAAADPRRRIGRRVEVHDRIGSTNDRARALLAEPSGEGVAVVAELQTSGRGRHGRSWSSPPGRNLMVSVALRPTLPVTAAWMLSATTGLALRAACERTVPSLAGSLALKWPNDLVSADGRKVAGILVETAVCGDRLAQAVVGAGINVNWRTDEMPPEIATSATSLVELGGAEVNRVALLAAYLEELERGIAALETGASPLAAYRAASWLDGRFVRVATGDRELEGRVAGIGDGGALLVELPGERLRLEQGEVLRVGQAGEAVAP